ncbi:glutamate-5-semialdehyde dehydrogenase [Mycetocola zhadangensis]|uniref:Gamma-glutamyl phosphate reductase n=1 Tax=Mycetocola zhadangensis TaxID=1164595 RepID=A0A3L7J669_9MICO|nr:glutamate-5-semialdehyde dehydrogenase [Mycetocola zhadangensis]RLQ85959.1 glutamate-5-semialdehyde dehydrogenase [Mycetocola zhadangensis]GGE87246.1 gamma-glutamyl phosphate reductase [Mycetocola zhadangensis]
MTDTVAAAPHSPTSPTLADPGQSVSFDERLLRAREASRTLATASGDLKNAALEAMANGLAEAAEKILAANARDLDNGRTNRLSDGLLDRLRLDENRLAGLSAAIREIAALTDPIGQSVRGSRLPNGVRIDQIRVPFGVVGAIYEARPNVTVDIAALALKSGNAVVLRGGSAAENTNGQLVEVIQDALGSVGLPSGAVQTIDEFGRDGATRLMQARGLVDVLVPRGSASLIQTVVTESRVPVIETGAGVVHIYLDETAREDWAADIVHNAKVQRPSVCNAVETVLVHAGAAGRVLPGVLQQLADAGVTIHGDEATRTIWPDARIATEEDWATEHMSLDISVRVVDDLDQAIEHIRTYSTGHTESIITESVANAERFLAEVDSAVVMVNASTRFTDGGEFGFGAEVGISTQKLHARGPMGVSELTSTKWIVRGTGQVRS